MNLEKAYAQVPQRETDGYDGPLKLGTRVRLTDSFGADKTAVVWQEPGERHGMAVFHMDEPNSGGYREKRPWHGEVEVL